jgi:hypothetical protein
MLSDYGFSVSSFDKDFQLLYSAVERFASDMSKVQFLMKKTKLMFLTALGN